MSIFSIGVSGLNTAQLALNTTSNNISNVNTPGYNRELPMLAEREAGGGTEVTAIERQFDQYIASQLNSTSSRLASLESYQTQISQIDNLLADNESGVAPVMENFFSALQDLTAAPSDPAARQGVLGTAESLTAQFRSLDGYLHDMQQRINGEIDSEVTQINNTVEQIAELNNQIGIARAKNGEAPNTLLNQRDHLVSELNGHIDVDLHVQGTDYNLTVGNGQPLVAGTEAYSLSAVGAAADPSRTVVAYVDSAGNRMELDEGQFEGGRLGGLMNFRSETLDDVQNRLGQMAVSLAQGFNEQHQAGTDLNGDPGERFFSVAEPRVFSHENNAGGAVVSAAFEDHQGLTGADYDLRVSDAAAGEFEISRRGGSDRFTAVLDGSDQLRFDGLVLSVDDPSQLVDGDRYQLQPTRHAAGEIDTRFQDTSRIAAGQSAASGDNRNALALERLQDSPLVGGDANLSQAYASLVGDVGNQSNIIQANRSAQESLTEQVRAVQQSESGVNLDEEAANLIRYQQYYQANAKVIEVGATVLDTLLNLRA